MHLMIQERSLSRKERNLKSVKPALEVNKFRFFTVLVIVTCVVICFLLFKILILKPGHVQSCNRKVLLNIFKRRIKEDEPKPVAEIEPERAPVKFSNYTENNLKKRT